ncbi:MAG: hypothetical protein ACEQSB_07695, partial [Undibacterium sp.]
FAGGSVKALFHIVELSRQGFETAGRLIREFDYDIERLVRHRVVELRRSLFRVPFCRLLVCLSYRGQRLLYRREALVLFHREHFSLAWMPPELFSEEI